MKSKIMNPHKISAHSDNKQKSYGMLLIELVTWGVTNRDVLLLATIRYAFFYTHQGYCHLVNMVYKPAYDSHNLLHIILLKWIESCKMLEYNLPAFDDMM